MEKMAEKFVSGLNEKKTTKTFFSWNINVVIYIIWWDMALPAKDQKTLHYLLATHKNLRSFCPPPQEKFDF